MIALLLLMAQSPAEQDRASLGRYLGATEVAAAVAGLADLLAPCGEAQADGAWPLSLALAGEGRVEQVVLDGAPAPVAACVRQVLGEAKVPAHDEEPLVVRTTLVLRDGRARPGPTVDFDERRVTTLYLALPPDLDQAARTAVEQALGLASPQPTGAER